MVLRPLRCVVGRWSSDHSSASSDILRSNPSAPFPAFLCIQNGDFLHSEFLFSRQWRVPATLKYETRPGFHSRTMAREDRKIWYLEMESFRPS